MAATVSSTTTTTTTTPPSRLPPLASRQSIAGDADEGDPEQLFNVGVRATTKIHAKYPYPKTALTHPRICVASVEGGIGAGKTTWLDRVIAAIKTGRYGANLHVVLAKEPVETWQNIGVFERFLSNQKRWAAYFQNLTYATRVIEWDRAYEEALDIVKSDAGARVIVLLERSPFSDRYFFAELQHEMGNIDDVEWAAYMLWFVFWCRVAPSTIDFCLWLKTDVAEAVKRMKIRDRKGENDAYDDSYLRQLHGKHEQHMGAAFCEAPVVHLDGNLPFHQDDDVLHAMCLTLMEHVERTLQSRCHTTVAAAAATTPTAAAAATAVEEAMPDVSFSSSSSSSPAASSSPPASRIIATDASAVDLGTYVEDRLSADLHVSRRRTAVKKDDDDDDDDNVSDVVADSADGLTLTIA